MKKHLFGIAILISCLFVNISSLEAQTHDEPTASKVILDPKAQAKVDKANVNLAKNTQKLNKEIANYEKAKEHFDKEEKAGRLSPKDKSKLEKKFTKDNLKIGKLKQQIAKDEEFLAKYNL